MITLDYYNPHLLWVWIAICWIICCGFTVGIVIITVKVVSTRFFIDSLSDKYPDNGLTPILVLPVSILLIIMYLIIGEIGYRLEFRIEGRGVGWVAMQLLSTVRLIVGLFVSMFEFVS